MPKFGQSLGNTLKSAATGDLAKFGKDFSDLLVKTLDDTVSAISRPVAALRTVGNNTIAVFNDIAKALKSINTPGKLAKAAITRVGQTVTGMASGQLPAAGFANAMQGLMKPMQGVMAMAGGVGAAISGVTGGFQQAFGAIQGAVAKADPAAAMKFQIALDDLTATMGQIVAPVLKAGTGLIRKFADMLMTMQPAFKPLIGVMTQLMDVVGQLLLPVFKIFTVYIQVYGAILNAMMPVVNLAAQVLMKLADAILYLMNKAVEAYNEIARSRVGRNLGMKTLDIKQFDDFDKKSSVGASVRPASFIGAAELGRQARQTAFASGASPEVKAIEGVRAEIKFFKEWAANIVNNKRTDEAAVVDRDLHR